MHAKGQTTNLLRKSKRIFFSWKNRREQQRVRINEITTENEAVSDESVIANELNEYFVNILEQIGNNNDPGVDFESTSSEHGLTRS